jgi:hypothetical protein
MRARQDSQTGPSALSETMPFSLHIHSGCGGTTDSRKIPFAAEADSATKSSRAIPKRPIRAGEFKTGKRQAPGPHYS